MPIDRVTACFRALKGTSTFQVQNESISVVVCLVSTEGGVFCGGIFLPPDVDVSRPIRIFTRVFSVSLLPTGSADVVFQAGVSGSLPDGTLVTRTFIFTWTVPDPFTTGMTQELLLDDGSGVTLAGGELSPGDYLGLALTRLGSDIGDTYIRSIGIAPVLVIEYFKRCQFCCC